MRTATTGREFRKATKAATQPLEQEIPAEFFYADPSDWNVFDITNPWYDHGDDFSGDEIDGSFDANEHLSPGL